MDADEWTSFRDRARADGKLIELVIADIYTNHLPVDGVALDGGANVGLHTKGLARRMTEGRVVAVEANAATLKDLQRGTSTLANVEVVWAALQDDPDRASVTFNCSTSHPGRSGISRLWDRISPGQVTYTEAEVVPATTIDKLMAGAPRVDFIKLDLEGGEYHALHGGEQTLRRARPLVVSEHSMHAPVVNGFAIADYLAWIDSLGYTPISPFGERVTVEAPFPFWYVFLVPIEHLQHWRARIGESLDRYR